MHRLTRHLRGLLVAFAALALTAGAVFAAKAQPTAPPAAAAGGLSRASEAAGRTVPANDDHPAVAEPDANAEPDADAEQTDGTTTGDTNAAADRQQNHGWFVSQAAKDHSLTGRSHGEAVSAVAQSDQGKSEQPEP